MAEQAPVSGRKEAESPEEFIGFARRYPITRVRRGGEVRTLTSFFIFSKKFSKNFKKSVDKHTNL